MFASALLCCNVTNKLTSNVRIVQCRGIVTASNAYLVISETGASPFFCVVQATAFCVAQPLVVMLPGSVVHCVFTWSGDICCEPSLQCVFTRKNILFAVAINSHCMGYEFL